MKNSSQQQHRYIISGGGTGGHIFPAIAIANAISAKVDAEILFIGAKGKMEMEKVPAAGYKIEGLWISGLQRKLSLKNLSFPLKVISSLNRAKKIIKAFKPEVVIGVGGFASGPTLKAAQRKGIPTLIQEQNSFPGITNKLLAKSVNKICVAWEGLEKYFPANKIVITGNPIRKEVIQIEGKRKTAAAFFGLDPAKKTVLVVGGSQGSLAINKSIQLSLDRFKEDNVQLVWQTGIYFFDEADSLISDSNSGLIKVVKFIDRMDLAYALADVIVSRAGAIAISEICAVAKPPIFIPLPSAAEDHQTKNAESLEAKNAAILLHQNEADEKLGQVLFELIHDEKRQKELAGNLNKLAVINSADKIADEIIKLRNESKTNVNPKS
ncbi:MAG: undecaprenyldiphospho-muramoylpentapeptide beta-N-acetylglucosaminyltransferase [Bacteroidales bacterium]|nr:undecaprenyldiphospho-muramoylpentapeptide beta-N-acetylglucosaminyltransferase [Bacteroidales bacterium]MCF8404454.1 undecaprenyldiphospho-muramoylpentapeptide beta-N-acetylglucosaminyltransferase [Bacteroidales bacterium]